MPHDVTVDDDDRVYVMDRENHRCQVFDNDGAYIAEWKGMGYPCRLGHRYKQGDAYRLGVVSPECA